MSWVGLILGYATFVVVMVIINTFIIHKWGKGRWKR